MCFRWENIRNVKMRLPSYETETHLQPTTMRKWWWWRKHANYALGKQFALGFATPTTCMHKTFAEQRKRELNVWRKFYAGFFFLCALHSTIRRVASRHPSIYSLHPNIMNAYLFTKRNKIVRPLWFLSSFLPFPFFRHFFVSRIHSHWRHTVKWIAYIECREL